MALLNPTKIVEAGAVVALAAATALGDTIANHTTPGNLFFRVKNAGGVGITVTIASPTPCSQGHTHPLAVAVAAGAEKDIGPLPARRYRNPVTVTYDSVAGVTVGAFIA